ncbi:MAG: hypothetical protein ACXWDO_07920, partial [Bacteroidia bacterium]
LFMLLLISTKIGKSLQSPGSSRVTTIIWPLADEIMNYRPEALKYSSLGWSRATGTLALRSILVKHQTLDLKHSHISLCQKILPNFDKFIPEFAKYYRSNFTINLGIL